MTVESALPQASEPYATPSRVVREDVLGLRIAAALVDLVLLGALFLAFTLVVGESSVDDSQVSFALEGMGAVLTYAALVLVYYFVLEATIGQTVGKRLLGVRVVRQSGERPSVWSVVVRTVIRVVDWLPALYLVGFVTVLATGARRQRLGDLAGGTTVARATPLRHRGISATAVATILVLVVAGSVWYAASAEPKDQTYSGHGISFEYPATWEQSRPEFAARAGGGDELWTVAVGVSEVDMVSVQAFGLSQPITAENIDLAESEFTELVEGLFEQSGGSMTVGPVETAVAGLPALRYEGTAIMEGTPIGTTLVAVFDGTTEYSINCQSTTENAAEIEQGCGQILRTLEVAPEPAKPAAEQATEAPSEISVPPPAATDRFGLPFAATLPFDVPFQYQGGPEVWVGHPTRFEPSEWGKTDFPHHVRFAVRFTNDTERMLDLWWFGVEVRSGGVKGKEAFNDDLLRSGPPPRRRAYELAPGQSFHVTLGFGVKDADDIRLEIWPDLDHDSVIYTNSPPTG